VSKVVTKGIEQMICTQTTLPSDSGNVNWPFQSAAQETFKQWINSFCYLIACLWLTTDECATNCKTEGVILLQKSTRTLKIVACCSAFELLPNCPAMNSK
jgi:hypothetical protein